jgi:DNA-binding XRE family transcriptional regulator
MSPDARVVKVPPKLSPTRTREEGTGIPAQPAHTTRTQGDQQPARDLLERPARFLDPVVASALREARVRLGSQHRVARQLGISRSFLIDLERGRRRPSVAIAQLLIDGLRLDSEVADALLAAAVPDAGRSRPGWRLSR